ncbi:MAG: hypothetical protein NT010_13015 [Proteobacteria bacterium]|nr:hypothetical protein [Pseudomonadota bacterium]
MGRILMQSRWSRVKDYVKESGRTVKAVVLLPVAVLALGTYISRADAAMNDADLDAIMGASHTGITISNPNPNPNPYGMGIVGIAGNYGNELAIVWQYGTVGFYNASNPNSLVMTGLIRTISAATAVTYLINPPAGMTGDIAVADSYSIWTYMKTGALKQSFDLNLQSGEIINDLKIEDGKVYIATTKGMGTVNPSTGNITYFGTGSCDSVQPIDFIEGLSPRIFTQSGSEYYRNPDGSPNVGTGIITDMLSRQGYGVNEGYLWGVRALSRSDLWAWDALSGLTEKQSTVPIPGALWLFGPGLVGLAAIRRKFTK